MATIFQARNILFEFSYTQKKTSILSLNQVSSVSRLRNAWKEPENKIQEFSRPKVLCF